jgi:hypothetical protein
MIEESPPKKRLRQDVSQQKETKESRLFVPFRALGLITNHVPFVLQTRSYKGATDGPRVHLLTCLGRAWALWEGGKMGLLFVGMYALRITFRLSLTICVIQVQMRLSIYQAWLWTEMLCGLHRRSSLLNIIAGKRSVEYWYRPRFRLIFVIGIACLKPSWK